MKQFKIDGELYTLKTYTDEQVCKYAYNQLGTVADKMTVYEYNVLKHMMNLGFTPNLSYYGRPTGELYPQAMWYSYVGVLPDGGFLDYKLCCKLVPTKDGDVMDNIVVYVGGDEFRKFATFTCVADVVKCFRIDEAIPAVVNPLNSTVATVKKRVDTSEFTSDNFVGWNNGEFTSKDTNYTYDFSKLRKVEDSSFIPPMR
jgi:hypothetical protein